MTIGHKALGVDVTAVHTAAQHPLGFRAVDDEGKEYVYVKAGGSITAKNPVKIAASWVATASGNAGRVEGVAVVGMAANDYGFVQTRGVVDVDADSAVAQDALLSLIANASGQMVAVAAVAESGSATHVSGALTVRAVALAADTANVAPVRLL